MGQSLPGEGTHGGITQSPFSRQGLGYKHLSRKNSQPVPQGCRSQVCMVFLDVCSLNLLFLTSPGSFQAL